MFFLSTCEFFRIFAPKILNNMKHTFKTILVAAMAVVSMAFAGCTKEDNNNSNISTNGGSVPAGWVDLGLPSGLLWAECNVGANVPEGYGDYFAWGETQPKNNYSWSTYAYGNGAYYLIKYCNNSDHGINGFTDNLTNLIPSDDAATALLGNGARTPTVDEWNELINNTTAEWTIRNGVDGKKFTATNGNSIFLPAAGYRHGSELDYAHISGYYWSSSLYLSDPGDAGYVFITSSGPGTGGYGRLCGLNVRAVRAR